MELKVGKGKDVDIGSLVDVAKTKSDIRFYRNIVEVLKNRYEEATTNEDKRVIGMEINSVNSSIKVLRDDLSDASLDSVFYAQRIESEIGTAQGELVAYSNIDQSKVDDVLKEFSGRYYDMNDVRDEIARKLETAVGSEKRNLQDKIDVLSTAILQVGIVVRKEMVESLLPDAEGIHSVEDVAEDAKAFAEIEKGTWFDNGDIKDASIEVIKYGNLDEYNRKLAEGLTGEDNKRIFGILEDSIERHINEINSVGGVWTDVGETDAKKGTKISFSESDLKKLISIKTPEEMVAKINDMCTTNQRYEFLDTIWDVDDGEILEKVDIVCNVEDSEIYEAFHRMKELEAGVVGSGYEYMRSFLKILFKYGAFEDDVFDDLANYDSKPNLMDRIEKEIHSCSCSITDTHEKEVEAAFDDRQAIERDSKGSGAVFMNRALRNIFSCDTFEDHVYKEMSEYEDPRMLVSKINTELSETGVYDNDVLKYAIGGINRRYVLSKETAEKQLDDVFGDHFTKREYEEAAKHVMSENAVVDNNRDALIKRFRTIGKEGQILTGKILEGISNKDYNDRWENETKKMEEHGETKNIEAIILKRKLSAAQKQFAILVAGIDDASMSSRDDIQYVFESVGLQDYVVSNLATSVTDIEYVVDDNIQKLTRGMRSLIKKHDMYEDDIFTERRIYDAVTKRMKMELGDDTAALEYMKASILESVGKLDMTNYSKSIASDISEKIKTNYGDIDEGSLADMLVDTPEDDITIQFSRRIRKYKRDAHDSMVNAEKAAIRDLYAGRSVEDDVDVPPELSVAEMKRKHEEELEESRKKAKAETAITGVPKRLAPFLSYEEIDDYTAAIPKKPKKPTDERGVKEMKWWESFMAKNEPLLDRTTAFNKAGLALAMRKGAGDKYVVFGEGGESVGFSNLAKLDKWFKSHYSKPIDKWLQ